MTSIVWRWFSDFRGLQWFEKIQHNKKQEAGKAKGETDTDPQLIADQASHILSISLLACILCPWDISLNVNSPWHVDVVLNWCFQIQPKFINTLVMGRNLTGRAMG